jgi:hypothetical protein
MKSLTPEETDALSELADTYTSAYSDKGKMQTPEQKPLTPPKTEKSNLSNEQHDQGTEQNAERHDEDFEKQNRDAETFVNDARETLKDPYQKEVFDAAMSALTPQEKVAYYRDQTVWFNSCDKQSKSAISPADTQDMNKSVFAKDIAFSGFDYNIQMSSGLRSAKDASKADYLLNVSETDRQTSDQAHEKMAQASKQYLKEHPDVAKIIQRQQKEDEQKVNEVASDDRRWGANGESNKNFKSPEEMKRDASKELQAVIDQVNGRKGIKFELETASQHDKETGERLSVRIIPKDQNQSEQVQGITKKVVGSFEKERQGLIRKTETLKVTSDAETLKECIASVVAHSYVDKKKVA